MGRYQSGQLGSRTKNIDINKGGYQSGQMGQTVNLLPHGFVGSNPTPPTS